MKWNTNKQVNNKHIQFFFLKKKQKKKLLLIIQISPLLQHVRFFALPSWLQFSTHSFISLFEVMCFLYGIKKKIDQKITLLPLPYCSNMKGGSKKIQNCSFWTWKLNLLLKVVFWRSLKRERQRSNYAKDKNKQSPQKKNFFFLVQVSPQQTIFFSPLSPFFTLSLMSAS